MEITQLLDIGTVRSAHALLPAVAPGPACFVAGLAVLALALLAATRGRLGRAIRALRRTEALNRAILGAMMDGCITLDAAGVIVSLNPAAEQLLGLPAGAAIGHAFRDFLTAEAQDRLAGLQRRARMAPGSDMRFVCGSGGRRADGSDFPVEIAVSGFELEGRAMWSCVVRDLTASWAAQEESRRMVSALEQAADAIAVIDADHVVRYVNRQYEIQRGFMREEVVGLAPARGASSPETYQTIRETIVRGDPWSGVVKSRRRDGTVFDEDLSITPVRDENGRISAYVAVMRDVSRRSAMEAERAGLAEAIHHASDCVQILDAQGAILYANPAWEKATGLSLRDIRGTRPEALRDYSPDLASYEDMLRTVRGGYAWSGVLTSIAPDGHRTEEHVTASPVRDATTRQVRSFVVVKHPVQAREEPRAVRVSAA
jgi:PAS domain S-box-containing protein